MQDIGLFEYGISKLFWPADEDGIVSTSELFSDADTVFRVIRDMIVTSKNKNVLTPIM